MIHYAIFTYDDEKYVAAGVNKMYMAVYKEYTPRVYHRWGETQWPSWAKFMHGDVTGYEEGEVKDIDELKERFGRFIPGQNNEVGKQMAERTADSRWTDNPFQPPNASPELLEWYEKRDEAIRIWRKIGVFASPVFGTASINVAAKLFGLAFILFISSIFVLAGHYDLYCEWGKERPRGRVTEQEFSALGVSVTLLLVYVVWWVLV